MHPLQSFFGFFIHQIRNWGEYANNAWTGIFPNWWGILNFTSYLKSWWVKSADFVENFSFAQCSKKVATLSYATSVTTLIIDAAKCVFEPSRQHNFDFQRKDAKMATTSIANVFANVMLPKLTISQRIWKQQLYDKPLYIFLSLWRTGYPMKGSNELFPTF